MVSKRHSSFVYVFRCLHLHKIGWSSNPKKRLADLREVIPFPVDEVHVIQAIHAARFEKALHLLFKDKRVKGEWFSLTVQDVASIALLDEDTVCAEQLVLGGDRSLIGEDGDYSTQAARLMGQIGGRRRAMALSARRRSEIARMGGIAKQRNSQLERSSRKDG